MINNNIILKCTDVSKFYQEEKKQLDILKNVSFSINASSSNAILGSSGSGKSTLLHILAGLDSLNSGEIIFNNKNISNLNSKEKAKMRNYEIGFIYQFHHLLPDFTALENAMMPLLIRAQLDKKSGLSKKSIKEKAMYVMNKVGLSHRLNHKPSKLSGGEKQRVAIARAVITQPKIIFADEPTGNLDNKTSNEVFELLMGLKSEFNTTLLIVTHDMNLAKQLDCIYMLQNGHLAPC
tara:strand:+ start:531 stop:1238 length:708 start_codon:yes stop_codon:yes gene_type:complete